MIFELFYEPKAKTEERENDLDLLYLVHEIMDAKIEPIDAKSIKCIYTVPSEKQMVSRCYKCGILW